VSAVLKRKQGDDDDADTAKDGNDILCNERIHVIYRCSTAQNKEIYDWYVTRVCVMNDLCVLRTRT